MARENRILNMGKSRLCEPQRGNPRLPAALDRHAVAREDDVALIATMQL